MTSWAEVVQRKRLHLLGGLVGLGGLAYLGLRPRERPTSSVGQPLLRLPFEAGTVVVCIQGSQASAPHTHSLPQNQHALDFAQPTDATVPVTSAAAGMVSFVHDHSHPEDVDAGLGYGNHVKVLHPGGFNTFYAHLDEICVTPGEHVESGQRIGTMGLTGRAGSRHLHFALHSSNTDSQGAGVNEAIERLVAAEASDGFSFRAFAGPELRGAPERPWMGGVYVSENDVHTQPSTSDSLHPPLLSVARAHHREVLATLRRRARVDEVARQRERKSPSWIRQELSEMLDEDPGLPAALYLRATVLEIPRGDWTAAHQSLDAALAEDVTPRRREPWLAGRASYHLGRVLRAEGNLERARASFQHALARSTSADLIADAKQALASLDAGRGR